MKAAWCLAVCLVVIGMVAGCSGPIGTWTLREIEPESAAAHFGLQEITFAAGGHYTAELKQGEKVTKLEGTYELDRESQTLRLVDQKEERYVYGAEICSGCGYLYLWDLAAPNLWKATLVRR